MIGLAGLSQQCFSAGLDLVSKSLDERLIVKSQAYDHGLVDKKQTALINLILIQLYEKKTNETR